MDLRDLAARSAKGAEFGARIEALRGVHFRKETFIARLRKADL